MSHTNWISVCGNRVCYYAKGSGPVLVLLHGMFGDHTDWDPVLDPLANNFRVIAPDLPGFGLSDKPGVDYGIEFFLHSLEGFFAALNLTRFTLAGNSFGGGLAILFALSHPERVESLILVSSGGLRPFDEEKRKQVAELFNEERLLNLTPQMHEWIFAPIFARNTIHRQNYITKQNAKLGRDDYPAYARSLFRSMQLGATMDLMDRLHEIERPTLLVWGDADPVFPVEIAYQAMQKLPSAQLVVVPHASHALQLDAPEEFITAVNQFVDGIVLRTSGASG